MKKFDVLNEIRENYLIAVVRGKGFEDTVKMIENIIEGGIKNIEITYTTPKASELIEHFATNSEACVARVRSCPGRQRMRRSVAARNISSAHISTRMSQHSAI